MRTGFLIVVFIMSSAGLHGCNEGSPPEEDALPIELNAGPREHKADVLIFGLYESDKASDMYRRFAPFIDELEREVNSRSEEQILIEIKIFGAYGLAISALAEGRVDFARFGPASYVRVKELDSEVELLAIEEKQGRTTFEGMLIVRQDSPIRGIEDLKGRRVAFGSRNSTIGRYLAQALLAEHGVHATDLARYEYLGRHDRVLKAVQLGDFDAGPVKGSTFRAANPVEGLRVLQSFTLITKPWVARSGLGAKRVTFLRESLLGMEDPKALAGPDLTGFKEASDARFKRIRDVMAASSKFEN